MELVTAAEMRTMDKETIEAFGIPGRILMENAGRGAVEGLLRVLGDLRGVAVGVAAGRGNNGGDGFVMARYLAQLGARVTVFLLAARSRVAGDARTNLDLLDPLGVPVVELLDAAALQRRRRRLQGPAVWIDAILGTGLNAPVRGHLARMIAFLNSSGRPVFAVDIPSGLHADTGQVLGDAVHARATATFALAKIGHQVEPGASLTGRLFVVDIGIPSHIVRRTRPRQHLVCGPELHRCLRPRPAGAHKGTTGHLLVVAGATGKTGAAVMTATAAMRIGAGLVTLGVPASLVASTSAQLREVMTAPLGESEPGVLGRPAGPTLQRLWAGKRCLALGPGIGTAEETGRLVQDIVRRCPVPLVIDADGLNLLAGEPAPLAQARAPVVLTPHPGEMARLLDVATAEVQADRLGAARTLAARFRVHVVLKGARTVTAAPDATAWINPTGNAGMAAGGMGDVLTGIIAGLVTQGYPPDLAARLGVFVHGAAADRLAAGRGPIGYLAGEVADTVPALLCDLAADPGIVALPVTRVPF